MQYTNNNINNNNNYLTLGVHESGRLATAYFSKNNIDILHEAIVKGVYRNSGGKYEIGKQDEKELLIIMRFYYMEHGSFTDKDLNDEIRLLNTMVAKHCILKIMNSINEYMVFVKDANAPLGVFENAINANNKGDKSIEMKPFF